MEANNRTKASFTAFRTIYKNLSKHLAGRVLVPGFSEEPVSPLSVELEAALVGWYCVDAVPPLHPVYSSQGQQRQRTAGRA